MTQQTVAELDELVSIPYWHIHHSGECIEFPTEPMKNRRDYIRRCKPAHEVETRLRLLQPVRGKLPEEVVAAGAAWDKAGAALDKTYAAWGKAGAAWGKAGAALGKAYAALDKARAARTKAVRDQESEINALHELECGRHGCLWTPKNRTIFPDEGAKT